MNSYGNEDKEQRRRIIIVATTIAVIILGIAVWSIIAIVGGSKKNTAEQTSQVATEDNSGKSTQINSKPAESNAPASEGVSTTKDASDKNTNDKTASDKTASSSASATSTPVVKTTTANNAVPETGPEEILPFALVAGCMVAYLSSKRLVTREA